MAILGIVLWALVQLFVSASDAQVEMSKRAEAQQNVRPALDKLRREIHRVATMPGDAKDRYELTNDIVRDTAR